MVPESLVQSLVFLFLGVAVDDPRRKIQKSFEIHLLLPSN
jgi:hypothetical protein